MPTARAALTPASRAVEPPFLGFLAHELRTPLATQRVLLELALAGPNPDATSWREIGEDVFAACLQQERLLEACLTLARSQGRTRRYDRVDLAPIAAAALEAHGPGDLELLVVLEPARMTGDRDLLERLAANLVSNAIRHNSAGGRVEIVTRTQSGRAHLMIANTGPLVPAGELQRLFQPFQRLAASGPRDGSGVGLGLAIVQAVADAHDAAIETHARPDGGLGIDVAFPGLD